MQKKRNKKFISFCVLNNFVVVFVYKLLMLAGVSFLASQKLTRLTTFFLLNERTYGLHGPGVTLGVVELGLV